MNSMFLWTDQQSINHTIFWFCGNFNSCASFLWQGIKILFTNYWQVSKIDQWLAKYVEWNLTPKQDAFLEPFWGRHLIVGLVKMICRAKNLPSTTKGHCNNNLPLIFNPKNMYVFWSFLFPRTSSTFLGFLVACPFFAILFDVFAKWLQCHVRL